MKRLAIITTHPIQYNAPLFALIKKRRIIESKVFYTWGRTAVEKKYDPGFNKIVDWDIPLTEGYDFEFVENVARNKGSHHYYGIINPGLMGGILDYNPDAILIYGWKFDSHLRVIRHFGKKVLIYFRGDSTLLDEKTNIGGVIKRILISKVFKHVDKAFYCGTNNRNYFLHYGLRNDQLVPAFHAVDNGRFDNSSGSFSQEALEWKSRFGIGQNDIVFLYAGKLTAGKNVPLLIEAFLLLKSLSCHLVIAGNGPMEIELKANYEVEERIHFIDFQNQSGMPALYQVCDVYVLPSNNETWGLSVNEAMASEKAVIVSDQCGCAIDLVANGINGYIFKAKNVESLYTEMQKCILDREHLQNMKRNSYQKIQKFTLEKVAIAIENTLIDA